MSMQIIWLPAALGTRDSAVGARMTGDKAIIIIIIMSMFMIMIMNNDKHIIIVA